MCVQYYTTLSTNPALSLFQLATKPDEARGSSRQRAAAALAHLGWPPARAGPPCTLSRISGTKRMVMMCWLSSM